MSNRGVPSAADEIRIHLKDTIRNRFFLILVALFAAIFLVQSVIYHARYQDDRKSELRANLELSRAVAKRFEGFVQDILHQELAIGLAIAQNSSPALIRQLLVRSKEEYEVVSSFSWIDPDGRVAHASLEGFVGVNVHDRDYFQVILQGADWFVSDLIISRTTGRLIFVINRGIYDNQGELLGVMAGGIYAERMEEILSIDRTGNGMVNVLDRTGTAVFEFPGYPWLLEKRRLLEEFPMIADAFRGMEVTATIEDFNGISDMVTAFTPVSNIGWIALAGRPHEEIVGPIFLDLLSHGMLFGFVVLLAFAAAIFFSRKLTDPLTRLRHHAAALGKGERVDPIAVKGVAELETLAEALNRMTAEIAVRETRIERERERAQDLAARMEQLQKIVDNIPMMVCLYDADDEIRIINKEFQTVLGWTSEDVKNNDVMALLYPDPEYRKQAIRFMESAAPGWRDFTVADRRGNTLHTSWANAKLSDGSRIGIGIDISWRVQVEQALKAYATQLEWSNRELQDFAFVASHDLQEPLRKIQAFGDLLRSRYEAELGEEGQDYLGRMQGAATRMRTLIDALLSYSRVTTKGQPFSPVDLAAMVGEAVSNLEMRISDTGAAVEWKELPTIEADPAQMMQLFQNLIGNGLKFNESKPPEIRIRGRDFEEEDPCEIRVADNGIGFDEKYIDRIFSPFQRLHGRNEYEGTGMGLAICRKIIERHNGTITAESRPDQGSVFIIRLPKKQRNGLSVPMESIAQGNESEKRLSGQEEK